MEEQPWSPAKLLDLIGQPVDTGDRDRHRGHDLIVRLTLAIPGMILGETALSFLGGASSRRR